MSDTNSSFLSFHLNGRSVYCAPANPAGRKLLEQFKLNSNDVVALVDNFKKEAGVINLPEQAADNAIVVIAAGSFQKNVLAQMLENGWSLSSIYIVEQATQKIVPARISVPLRLKRILYTFAGFCLRSLASKQSLKKYARVYYAEGFVDTNLAQLMAYDQRENPQPVMLIGLNLKTQPLPNNVTIKPLHSLAGVFAMLSARTIIVDHEYTSFLFSQIRRVIPVVQLWHGLPYKKISGNSHYAWVNDVLFVSSSHWFNKQIFSSIFRAKNYVELGYPRNDVLLAPDEERFWFASVSKSQLQVFSAQTSFFVYMPTYRDDLEKQVPDLPLLQRVCETCKVNILLKLHPFVADAVIKKLNINQADDSLTHLSGFPNLYLYPGHLDIYPWLPYSTGLITDYSSVVFDYLLVDKPIVYYQYDREHYMQIRGEALIDDADFIVGNIAQTEQKLIATLKEIVNDEDVFKAQRHALCQKLGINRVSASPSIMAKIAEIDAA